MLLLMATTYFLKKKMGQGWQMGGKVSGAKKKELEEDCN